MGKTIVHKENLKANIKLLAAQRYCYTIAKRYFVANFYISVLFSTILAIVNVMFEGLEEYIAIYSILVILLNYGFINNIIAEKQDLGASIQEQFDCNVLSIREHEMNTRLDYEEIFRRAARYDKENKLNDLYNWYDEGIAQVPNEIARIICQRTNIVYDKNLRKLLCKGSFIFGIIIISIALLVAFLTNIEFKELIIKVVLPLTPIIGFFLNYYLKQKSTIEHLEKLNEFQKKIWCDVLAEKITDFESKARTLQDGIFKNRSESPMVLDCLYYLFRDQFEKEATNSVAIQVQEYLNRKQQ